MALGLFKDNVHLLKAALTYLDYGHEEVDEMLGEIYDSVNDY